MALNKGGELRQHGGLSSITDKSIILEYSNGSSGSALASINMDDIGLSSVASYLQQNATLRVLSLAQCNPAVDK